MSGWATRWVSVGLALLLSTAARARADEPPAIVAVLPLNVSLAQLDKASDFTLEEDIRSIAGDRLTPMGYVVLTGENTLRVLTDNGIDPTKACEASCSLDAARELKAQYFISGTVAKSEGTYVAFIRLFEQKTGQQLASVELEANDVRDLRKQLEQKASELFAGIPSRIHSEPAITTSSLPPKAQATPSQPEPLPNPDQIVPLAGPVPTSAAVVAQSAPNPLPGTVQVGRFTVTAETVMDNQSGRMWQRVRSARAYDYLQAVEFCRGVHLGGFNGWRVPTGGEYFHLIEGQIRVKSNYRWKFFRRAPLHVETRVRPEFERIFPHIERDVIWALVRRTPSPTVGSDAVILEQDPAYTACTNGARCHVRCVR